jgi:glycosyltransferase involved in cell wall biosynthesis
MGVRAGIAKAALREHLTYDLGPLAAPIAASLYGAARTLTASPSLPQRARGFAMLMRLHSAAWSPVIDARILDAIRRADTEEHAGHATGLWKLFEDTAQQAARTFRAGQRPDPLRLVGSRMLVVKPARAKERGVLVVDYSYVFPTLAGMFDLAAIADRYTIVLEPSWAGTCTPDILLYSRLDRPVFVETIEPRDRDLLGRLPMPLEVAPVAANWWVDHRMRPPQSVPRDIDIAMVAAWADIKRHWRVFHALAELRRRGHRLTVALVGYRYDRTREDIEALATHFGVRDQIQTHERISQEDVAALLWRSKIHVLWSRRECANRAIVEAMLADVPVIVREGMTFGFHYPYINDQTGRFVPEAGLADGILEMIQNRDRYAPREWVLANMTCEQATATLERRLRERALADREPWTEGLVTKTSTLDTQRYWDPADRERFESDYRFIASCVRT